MASSSSAHTRTFSCRPPGSWARQGGPHADCPAQIHLDEEEGFNADIAGT